MTSTSTAKKSRKPSERNLPPDSSRSAEKKPPTASPKGGAEISVSIAFSADSSDDLFASVRAAVRESADFYARVSQLCETSLAYAGTCDHAPGVACFKSDAGDTLAKYRPVRRPFGVLNSDQACRDHKTGQPDTKTFRKSFFDISSIFGWIYQLSMLPNKVRIKFE